MNPSDTGSKAPRGGPDIKPKDPERVQRRKIIGQRIYYATIILQQQLQRNHNVICLTNMYEIGSICLAEMDEKMKKETEDAGASIVEAFKAFSELVSNDTDREGKA